MFIDKDIRDRVAFITDELERQGFSLCYCDWSRGIDGPARLGVSLNGVLEWNRIRFRGTGASPGSGAGGQKNDKRYQAKSH